MTHPLEYVPTAKPNPTAFVFSPSQFNKFIDKPWEWYRQIVQKLDQFEGNTASVLGTVVHYCAEQAANRERVDHTMIEDFVCSQELEDYDSDIVMNCYYEMADVLCKEFVLKANPLMVEGTVMAEVKNNFFVGGTADLLEGTKEDCILTDYKTYSSTTKPKVIPKYYKHQLLCYAFALRKMGYNVTRIRLVYVNRPIIGAISPKTGKQFKSYPSEVTELTEVLTEEDLAFIESMFDLAIDSLEAAKKHPELTHVIFHDNRLKEEK